MTQRLVVRRLREVVQRHGQGQETLNALLDAEADQLCGRGSTSAPRETLHKFCDLAVAV